MVLFFFIRTLFGVRLFYRHRCFLRCENLPYQTTPICPRSSLYIFFKIQFKRLRYGAETNLNLSWLCFLELENRALISKMINMVQVKRQAERSWTVLKRTKHEQQKWVWYADTSSDEVSVAKRYRWPILSRFLVLAPISIGFGPPEVENSKNDV